MSPLDQARTALAECDAPPSPRAGRFVRTWTWTPKRLMMVDADHLRAALAEVDRLTAALAWHEDRHGTRAEQEAEEAEAEAEWAKVEAMSEEEVSASLRAAGLDVEASQARTATLVRVCVQRAALAPDAHRWATIRDEVRRLDAIARPGAAMDDDDIMDTVVRVLRRAAGKGGSNG